MDEEETHVQDGKHSATRTFEYKKLRCTTGEGIDTATWMDRRMGKVVARNLGTRFPTVIAASTKLTDAMLGS